MALYYFRGVSFIKDLFVRYLRAIFMAATKEQIVFHDGTIEYKFSSSPTIVKKHAWDFRSLPTILIGPVNGKHTSYSVSKEYLNQNAATDADQFSYYGADIDLALDVEVLAGTTEERDKLIDITSIFLAHPGLKDYCGKQSVLVGGPPTIREGGPVYEPKIDFPAFNSFLNLPVVGNWQDRVALGERLIDIVTDLTLELSL